MEESAKKKSKGNVAEQKRRYREKYSDKVKKQKRAQKKRAAERKRALRPPVEPKPPKPEKPKRVALGIPFMAGTPEYWAAHYQLCKERKRVTTRLWRLKNPDKRASYRHARRTIEKIGEHFEQGFINSLLSKQKGKCVYCKTTIFESYHIDHIEPLSRGGAHRKNNVQLLCPSCNVKKSNHDPYFFAQKFFGKLF